MSTSSIPGRLTTRPAEPQDEIAWRSLFGDYASLGQVTLTGEQVGRVWSWILDPAAQTHCHLALDDVVPVGFAHVRVFERPITAGTGLWVDDLYVRSTSRGRGAARALLEAIRVEAADSGHQVVRWTTREDNVSAQRLYASTGTRAPVVVYNAEPLVRPGRSRTSAG
ncbi:GNAT family N-acetyltransferase [Actinotalea sp. K2]|uniref:GNAT family N-acetyltransferase n=1 Tax=Actinotalea sp. K2 TaxID=2939438 RepID=UPI0020170CCC|nr:GNAT family N-acetyltransferase [Actinotalea sp. K2]MCL3860776.1 GNAT family N-acetyltransferase [Actinotalea sp. K2]